LLHDKLHENVARITGPLLNEADEFKEIQDGRSKMADTKMTILSLI